jgi:hypothetical protein
MFALEKSLVYILNSISSNGSLLERMKSMAEKLGFDSDQAGILEDLIIENKQCYRRAEINTQAGIHRRPQPEPSHQEIHHLDGGNNACESCRGTLLNERGPASSDGGGLLAVLAYQHSGSACGGVHLLSSADE